MKEALSQAGIEYAYIDITSGMLPLKRFLKYRDSRHEFDEIREKNRVGVPCIVVQNDDGSDKIMFELPEDLDELK